jgi:eukaryotic-like serine/threonine-protein kinase
MEPCAEELIPLLIKSRLFDALGAREAFQQWQASCGTLPDDASAFRSWMVEQKLLTEYQSSLLGRGHTDGFFLRDFKILDRIGRGRMAGVYRATDGAGSVVAIKVLPPSKAKDPVLLARFQREARLTERLLHLNIMRAREVGTVDGFNYLVMDYLDGEMLDAVLKRRGKLGIEESVKLLEQALTGLQYIHEQGLVHRDLKPGNMMLLPHPSPGQSDATTGCILKILDFGLSRDASDDSGAELVPDLQLTATGAMLGTPDYVAPEQARDAKSADIRADIYSLGCVAYHLLTGHPPFPDKNAIRQMVRHATEPPASLEETRPDAPASLQKVVNRMLAKDPADRFETPAEALQALRAPTLATEEIETVPGLQTTSAKPGHASAATEPASVEFNFKGTDTPTTKQEIFTALAEGATTKTALPANTPAEIVVEGPRHSRDRGAQPAKAAVRAPKHETQTATPFQPSKRATKEQPIIDLDLIARPTGVPPAPAWPATRRDWGMFALGMTTVLLALALGALFSWITRGS